MIYLNALIEEVIYCVTWRRGRVSILVNLTTLYIKNVQKNELLIKLAPLSKSVINRQEHEELILRFFALMDSYPKFSTYGRGIGVMLDEYMKEKNSTFTPDEREIKQKQLNEMLVFVDEVFENGFCKKPGSAITRVFFEAISVGVHLALNSDNNLNKTKFDAGAWLKNEQFKLLISGTHRTHSPDKINKRIDFVKRQLINR